MHKCRTYIVSEKNYDSMEQRLHTQYFLDTVREGDSSHCHQDLPARAGREFGLGVWSGGVVTEEAMFLEDVKNGLRCWSGAEEGDHSVSQEELGMKLRNKTIITGLLETMVILWEGSRENLQQSKAKALRGRLVEAVGRSLPILFDQFKDSRCMLFKLVDYIL